MLAIVRIALHRPYTFIVVAALLAVPASTFSIEPKIVDVTLPQIPSGVPATMLQRRPDIAVAQRRMIAANANIGVARGAYFPSLTRGAQGGFQSTGFSNWLSAPSSFWAIGPKPLLGVFDGGLRRAQVAQARAEFDASAANYRATVVSAFQQVADSPSAGPVGIAESGYSAAERRHQPDFGAGRRLEGFGGNTER